MSQNKRNETGDGTNLLNIMARDDFNRILWHELGFQ